MRVMHSHNCLVDVQTSVDRKPYFESMIESGAATEVKTRSKGLFPRARVAIATEIFDRYVAWDTEAVRTHRVYLEEEERLNDLLVAASAHKVDDIGSTYFVLKAIPADGQSYVSVRTILQLRKLNNFQWLISS